jgi:DnaJ-class molecular chaperone
MMKLFNLAFNTSPESFEICPHCKGDGIIKDEYDDGFDIREWLRQCDNCKMNRYIILKEKSREMANPL